MTCSILAGFDPVADFGVTVRVRFALAASRTADLLPSALRTGRFRDLPWPRCCRCRARAPVADAARSTLPDRQRLGHLVMPPHGSTAMLMMITMIIMPGASVNRTLSTPAGR